MINCIVSHRKRMFLETFPFVRNDNKLRSSLVRKGRTIIMSSLLWHDFPGFIYIRGLHLTFIYSFLTNQFTDPDITCNIVITPHSTTHVALEIREYTFLLAHYN